MANAAICRITPRYIVAVTLGLNQTGSMKLNEMDVFFYTVKMKASQGPAQTKTKDLAATKSDCPSQNAAIEHTTETTAESRRGQTVCSLCEKK